MSVGEFGMCLLSSWYWSPFLNKAKIQFLVFRQNLCIDTRNFFAAFLFIFLSKISKSQTVCRETLAPSGGRRCFLASVFVKTYVLLHLENTDLLNMMEEEGI